MSGGLGITPRLALGRKQTGSPPAWTPSIHIDGTTFNTTQILSGFPGARDDVTLSTRTYLAAASGSNLAGGSLWPAVVKGTSAKLVINRKFGGGFANAVFVSVDGAAFANIPEDSLGTGVKGYFTLFTGLSDAEHYVVVRIGTGFGIDSLYWDDAHTDTLVLTGTAPYIEMCDQWAYAGMADALSIVDGMVKNSAANFTPAKTKQSIYSAVSNISSARIRGQFRSLQVACTGLESSPDLFTAVYVSVDGGAPTKYTFSAPGTGGAIRRITGLDDTAAHTYTVWTNYPKAQALFAVSGDSGHVDVGDKKRMHQYGDSITYGGGGAPVCGEVDVFRVAAAIGFAATTCGVSGQTINDAGSSLKVALPTYLAALTVTSADVAILAIGRNNISSGISAGEQTDFGDCIALLVAKGYGKIIVRGVLPKGDGTNAWTAENAALQAVVTALGNPNVVWCDVSACPTYTTQASDTTHPDTAGYAVIAAFVDPLYRAILGL